MLAEMFISVLIMSAVGSVLFLLLLAVKPLTERFFGVIWQFYIWLSVLMVMICPVKIKTELKLPQAVSQTISIVSSKPAYEISVFEDYSGVYMSQPVQTVDMNSFDIIAFLWFVITTGLFIKTVAANTVLKKVLYKNSVYGCEFENTEIRISDRVVAPILFGGLKTVLYIPKELYNTDKMQYITAHEGVHIRRNDIGIKWFAALVKCIHWFNPFVYYLARQINETCEISCDAQAAEHMCDQQRREYMKTILEISQNEINFKGSLSAGLSSGGKSLKRRFLAISKGSNTRPMVRVVGVTTAMIITFCSVYACGIIAGSAQQDSQVVKRVLVAEKKDLPEKEEKTSFSAVSEIAEITVDNDASAANVSDTQPTEEPKTEVVKKPVITGEFNSEGGDTRIIPDIKPDEAGCIGLDIHSNAQEVIDVFVNDGESGREVHSFSIPVSHSASYVIDGLDRNRVYDIVLRGTMRNNWKIESEYKIY